jgi:hypothetical protein
VNVLAPLATFEATQRFYYRQARSFVVSTEEVAQRSSGAPTWRREMKPATREEERQTEDEIARRNLGPRGVPGGVDTAKMTPQQAKNIPKSGDFDGHTA